MLERARAYVRGGLSVIPVEVTSKKPTIKTWKPYQKRLPEDKELVEWFGNGLDNSIAIITGSISGNLELLDFDFKGEFASEWRKRLPLDLFRKLVIESSQSGGFHVLYRCEAPVQKNLKLAQRGALWKPDSMYVYCGKEIKPVKKADGNHWAVFTLIETRGEGGYFICAPSKGYTLKQGDFSSLPLLTVDERKELISVARGMNKWKNPKPTTPPKPKKEKALGCGKQPGDDYNLRGNLMDLLINHGFKDTGRHGTIETGGKTRLLTRPGKDSGPSASIIDDSVFYVFSSNCPPFEPDKGYSGFHTFALLECDGDFSAAAKKLASMGYGDNDFIEPEWSDLEAITLPHGYVETQGDNGAYGAYGDSSDTWRQLETTETTGDSAETVRRQNSEKSRYTPQNPSPENINDNATLQDTNAHTPTHTPARAFKAFKNNNITNNNLYDITMEPADAESPEQDAVNGPGYSPGREGGKEMVASLKSEYRDWLEYQDEFRIDEFYAYASIRSREAKKAISKLNSSLVEQGELERTSSRGIFRKIMKQDETINWLEADESSVDISLPLGLDELVNIQPGNIIVFAGEPNSGKTAFLMDIALHNVDRFKIKYFSSEMGAGELKSRIFGFRDEYPEQDVISKFMKVDFQERVDHFADVILTGEGNLNIIDFLEIHDDFYKVGAYIAQIHNKLDGALAVIAIQKDKGKDFGKGGTVTAEKPRLYVNLGYDPINHVSTAHIIKAKNHKIKGVSPSHMKCDFNVVNGSKVFKRGGCDWSKDAVPLKKMRQRSQSSNDGYWEKFA